MAPVATSAATGLILFCRVLDLSPNQPTKDCLDSCDLQSELL